MATITLTGIGLAMPPVAYQSVNIKYRKTSDPDIASSYINLGNFTVNTNGNFLTPVVVSGLLVSTSYTFWIVNVCANSSITQAFVTVASFTNVEASQTFQKNNCSTGQSGTNVAYTVPAGRYTSSISQADADNQAQDDIAANGQSYANTSGICLNNSISATLTLDYYNDTTADLSFRCTTVGVTEKDMIVASTANGGPLQLPNDGSDPAVCYLLSSDKLPGPPVRRFAANIAYFIQKYPSITTFTFEMRGRSASTQAVSGLYALRTADGGHLAMGDYGGGLLIPGITAGGTNTNTGYSSHITAGADGTVGAAVGSPVLTLTIDTVANTVTPTTY